MDFKKKRWIIILLVTISYGAVWQFPYMLETYYIPVQQAFGFTNEQIGSMMTVFGIVSVILYFPGGYLSDKFSVKALITVSYLGNSRTRVLYAADSSASNHACHSVWLCRYHHFYFLGSDHQIYSHYGR